jgi:HSP20 family protein
MIYRRLFDFPDSRLRNHFAELDNLRQQMDLLAGRSIPAKAGVFPLINLTENKDNYYVRAELPGIKADELNIEAEGNKISVSGERKIPIENEKAKYHRIEREAGKFSRMISLQTDIDSEKIDASLKDGILKLTIPKAEKAKPKQIAVH